MKSFKQEIQKYVLPKMWQICGRKSCTIISGFLYLCIMCMQKLHKQLQLMYLLVAGPCFYVKSRGDLNWLERSANCQLKHLFLGNLFILSYWLVIITIWYSQNTNNNPEGSRIFLEKDVRKQSGKLKIGIVTEQHKEVTRRTILIQFNVPVLGSRRKIKHKKFQ